MTSSTNKTEDPSVPAAGKDYKNRKVRSKNPKNPPKEYSMEPTKEPKEL